MKNFLISKLFFLVILSVLSGCIPYQETQTRKRPLSVNKWYEHPKIECTQKNNIIDFSIKPHYVPEIKIAECGYCGNEAENVCENCRLAFYCSEQCMALDLWKHSRECNQLRQAYFGDLECMKKTAIAFLRKAIKHDSKDQFYLKRAFSWIHRTSIRMVQDASCCNDTSTIGASEQFFMELAPFFKALGEKNICTKEEMTKIGIEVASEAIEWVLHTTKSKNLVPPFAIRIYGLKVFSSPKLDPEKEFIPEKEWYEKRMKVVQLYQKNLNESCTGHRKEKQTV